MGLGRGFLRVLGGGLGKLVRDGFLNQVEQKECPSHHDLREQGSSTLLCCRSSRDIDHKDVSEVWRHVFYLVSNVVQYDSLRNSSSYPDRHTFPSFGISSSSAPLVMCIA